MEAAGLIGQRGIEARYARITAIQREAATELNAPAERSATSWTGLSRIKLGMLIFISIMR